MTGSGLFTFTAEIKSIYTNKKTKDLLFTFILPIANRNATDHIRAHQWIEVRAVLPKIVFRRPITPNSVVKVYSEILDVQLLNPEKNYDSLLHVSPYILFVIITSMKDEQGTYLAWNKGGYESYKASRKTPIPEQRSTKRI